MRDFSQLSEREILALAIGNEEEDGRIYLDIAERLREDYPASAKIFSEMAARRASIAASCSTSIRRNSASIFR